MSHKTDQEKGVEEKGQHFETPVKKSNWKQKKEHNQKIATPHKD